MSNFIFADKKMQDIWQDFIAHFKSESTILSYQTDILEFINFIDKGMDQITSEDVASYYDFMQQKVSAKILQPSTLAKKIRELNSFFSYLFDNKGLYGIDEDYRNYFEPYLKLIEKVSKQANAIPVEDIDAIFVAAQQDSMAYCMLTFLYRMGLSTTEIGELQRNDISLYDNGAYLFVPGRQAACFIPEDVYHILEDYLSKSEEKTYLFYNKRGNKINSMYFSRLMKKYTLLAGVPSYSAEALRNSCAYTMFAYHAKPEEVAQEMGVTETQIRRYKNLNYLNISSRKTRNLVKIKVEPPS
ncbi:tyrosine-type recombinase/integrase [Mediterraneibacter gnavus]|uniref:tyrosine-type recombinase/integrase n=1 Tax=Mediterraneibacter gnavus TaxID=33038 RepID=UPI0034B963AB